MKMIVMNLTITRQSQEWGVCTSVNTSNSVVGTEPTKNKDAYVNKADVP